MLFFICFSSAAIGVLCGSIIFTLNPVPFWDGNRDAAS